MAGLDSGFEGYLSPNDLEVQTALEKGLIVLDTNVLLDLYSHEHAARETAFEILDGVKDRLWLPHQVAREFWRNRNRRISSSRPKAVGLDKARDDVFSVLNGLRPDNQKEDAVESLKVDIRKRLDEIEALVTSVRGELLDVDRILVDSSLDFVLKKLLDLFEDRVGEPLSVEDEAALIAEGLRRFADGVPPGFEDEKKTGPEQGTGDFLFWDQTLEHVAKMTSPPQGLVIVTNDVKSDWRTVHPDGKTPLGVRPELVHEARKRAKVQLFLLRAPDFYQQAGHVLKIDAERTESLVSSSDELSVATQYAVSTAWESKSYEELLDRLIDEGYDNQAVVIRAASSDGGFLTRERLFELCEFESDRSLVRFATPAVRIASNLVESGMLDSEADVPLRAQYNGPGPATGYRVPDEFVEFERRRDASSQRTWIECAVTVAQTDPERWWTVNELLQGIRDQELRDLSSVKTPAQTLRRDLNTYGLRKFSKDGSRFRFRGSDD